MYTSFIVACIFFFSELKKSVHILDISPLSDRYITSILFESVTYLLFSNAAIIWISQIFNFWLGYSCYIILYKFYVYSIIACYLYALQSDHHNKLLSGTIPLTPFPHFSHSLTVIPSGISSLYLWGLFCLFILLSRFRM